MQMGLQGFLLKICGRNDRTRRDIYTVANTCMEEIIRPGIYFPIRVRLCISSDRSAVYVLLYRNMFSQSKILGVPNQTHSENLNQANSVCRDACEASAVKAGQLPPRINCLSEASFVSGGIKAVQPEQETQCGTEAELPSSGTGNAVHPGD